MPRQIDLRPQNLKVTNNPNNQLGFTQEQIVHLQDQIPAALEKAELTFINSVLAAIDQATGLDLEKFTQDALTHITYTGNLASDLWNYYVGTNTTANNALANWETTLSNLGQATITDLNDWWQQAQTDAANGAAWVTRVVDDLRITSDVFHVTYQVGSSGDAPGTLGTNGKPTWYSAWNDLLALSGVVHSTTAPTDAAPTTGSVIQANTAAATTAGTNASLAIAQGQAITDGIYQASNGGTTIGNPTSTVVTSLTNIPASNIIGSTGATVTFGAVGGGNSGTSSVSWSHTIASTDLGVVALVGYYHASTTTITTAVTYGGTAMTKVGSQASTALGGNVSVIEAWWLKAPPSGTKTVAVTSLGGTATMMGNSVSYLASKIGTVVGSTGGSTATPAMTASSSTGNMVIGAFDVIGSSAPALSSYNQTSRSSLGPTSGQAFVVGDANGASSVTFSVNSSTTSDEWSGLTVELSN